MSHTKLTCLVDDNADYRLIIQFFFQRSHPQHPIHLFASGESFIEALAQMSQLPDLILLDRHMPGMDGHQTLEWLKRHPIYKRIPVVMMSAEASMNEIDNCYESGTNSFLKKSLEPVSMQDTLATICRYWLEMNQVPSLASS